MAAQAGERTGGGLPQVLLEARQIRRRKLRNHLEPKRLFAREIVIEGALGHPGRLQHVLDARMVVPLLQDELESPRPPGPPWSSPWRWVPGLLCPALPYTVLLMQK